MDTQQLEVSRLLGTDFPIRQVSMHSTHTTFDKVYGEHKINTCLICLLCHDLKTVMFSGASNAVGWLQSYKYTLMKHSV